jgi:hypothetical protein
MENSMKQRIIDFLKCKEFLAPFFSGIAVLIVWTIIKWIVSLAKGLDIHSAFVNAIDIANTRVSLLWVLVIVLFFSLINGIILYNQRKNNENTYVKRDYLTEKLKNKLDTSTFESFHDTYDIRRLESHPWHDQHTGTYANINTYIFMLSIGLDKRDFYKVENAIRGLITEIKTQGFLHKSDKSDIINKLSKYSEGEYNEYKEELLKLLDDIKLI